MSTANIHALKLDFDGLKTRLIWANERTVEERFLSFVPTYAPDGTSRIWFLEAGEVTVTYAQASVRVAAGEWLFLGKQAGRQQFTPGARLLSLRFDLRLRGGKPLFARSGDLVVPGGGAPRLLEAARRLVAEFGRVNGPETLYVRRDRLSLVNNFAIESAFMGWLGVYVETMLAAGQIAEVPEKRDPRVAKALALIEDHRMQDRFSETGLAHRCGLSASQLARLFRTAMGVSPFHYYERRRMELARHALQDSTLPVKEISFDLGFSLPSHFSRWFAERAGMPPGAWRKNRGVPGPAEDTPARRAGK